MKIWRRENTKVLKNLKKEKPEEFTDISLSSTPKNQETKKDKMEEIYSTKDKQVKYKRQTPLEAEEAAKRAQEAKEKLQQGEAEIALNTPKLNEEIVELTSDYEEGTVIADDIIEDVKEFSKERSIHVQDITEIDVDIDASDTLKKYERQKNMTERHEERVKRTYENEFERLFGKPKFDYSSEKVVAKIPTYQHDSKVNLINLKAGRFSDVVESEYDEYLKAIDPTSAKRKLSNKAPDIKLKPIKQALSSVAQKKKASDDTAVKPPGKFKRKTKKFLRITKAIIFPDSEKKKEENANNKPKTSPRPISQDSKQVDKQTKSNYKHLTFRCVLFSVLFILSLVVSLAGKVIFEGIQYSSLIYCAVSLVSLLLCGAIAWPYLVSGLKPLKRFKGNCDTALSCAYIACVIQHIGAMFTSDVFMENKLHLYTPIITLAFALSVAGRMFMVQRVKNNFDYIKSQAPGHIVKLYNDRDTSRKMLSGTTASRSLIAYQHKTNHLSDFLKISYAPDPSEELCSKFAPITIVCAIFVTIVYGIMSQSIVGALCALAVMCCISIPLCSLVASNLALLITGKDNLKHNAVISGYPSVKQFSECDAVTVNAYELYPKGSIKLEAVKNFVDYRLEESLLCAALVMKEAKSPLYHVLEDVLHKNKHTRLKVESVLYEDKLGLVGWINGERVLVGNRELLDRFHIYLSDASDETKYTNRGKNVTYIACAGQLVCMLITSYRPDPVIKNELFSAVASGLCLLVSTSDPNITADKIASNYDIFYRTIKILPSGYATTCNELSARVDEASRAYVATNGKFSSFLHAVTSCINFKQNFTIAMIVQIFGLILGVLLCATMVLYDSVSILGVVEVMLYMLFWSIATVAVQFIKRH